MGSGSQFDAHSPGPQGVCWGGWMGHREGFFTLKGRREQGEPPTPSHDAFASHICALGLIEQSCPSPIAG